jgi:homoserine O-acetyltransferase
MTTRTFKEVGKQEENPFSQLVQDQKIVLIPEVTLECGDILHQVPVAYKTWGKMNKAADNVMVICHALTGSADVADWWGPLLGPGRAFDPTKFFIICLNSLGSPYGSASPCTIDFETGKYYGPEFPLVTVKDDVNIHKLILDDIGVKSIAVVIGGSMGGMLVLEYAYFGKDYVRTIVPLATCATHSAWGISWGETQRQSIYSDPKYNDGYYTFDDPPIIGLGAARMAAMLTYRSRNSFESKFGRNLPDPSKHKGVDKSANRIRLPANASEERWLIHNQGHQQGRKLSSETPSPTEEKSQPLERTNSNNSLSSPTRPQTFFTAQSYLRYQGEKFVSRFDANCYISITRKLDSHDVSRGRGDNIEKALSLIQQPTLVIGISSDGLFTFSEQEILAENIPNAVLKEIISPEGHDAFLLEFAEINNLIVDFLKTHHPNILNKEGISWEEATVGKVGKPSLFGEAEGEDVDLTSW